MANMLWNYLGQGELMIALKGLGAYSKVLTYASIGACFLLILLFVHIVTTLYEQYDQKWISKVSSDFQWTKKPTPPLPVLNPKRARFVRLQKDIEEKFQNSSMNKTYAFPRKED